MKIRVTFKDPDGPADCINEAVMDSVKEQGITDDDEFEAIVEARLEKVKKVTGKFFQYGEYVQIEVDTEAGTAIVLPAS